MLNHSVHICIGDASEYFREPLMRPCFYNAKYNVYTWKASKYHARPYESPNFFVFWKSCCKYRNDDIQIAEENVFADKTVNNH